MSLLGPVLNWLAPEPKSDKHQPASNRHSNTRDPRISSANDETPWPFVVSKMTDGDCPLLVHIREEWPLVVDEEVEDAVLIWQLESGGEDRAVGGVSGRLKGQAVEGGEHAEF